MAELSDSIYEDIKTLCAEADMLLATGDYADAISSYWAAFELLPDPKTEWQAATWILASIGDANFSVHDFEAGRDNLSTAMHCPDGIGNPFLHLRLGQCQLELNNLESAADELARAYMGAGAEIFAGDDPKYFAFLKTRLKPPAGVAW